MQYSACPASWQVHTHRSIKKSSGLKSKLPKSCWLRAQIRQRFGKSEKKGQGWERINGRPAKRQNFCGGHQIGAQMRPRSLDAQFQQSGMDPDLVDENMYLLVRLYAHTQYSRNRGNSTMERENRSRIHQSRCSRQNSARLIEPALIACIRSISSEQPAKSPQKFSEHPRVVLVSVHEKSKSRHDEQREEEHTRPDCKPRITAGLSYKSTRFSRFFNQNMCNF